MDFGNQFGRTKSKALTAPNPQMEFLGLKCPMPYLEPRTHNAETSHPSPGSLARCAHWKVIMPAYYSSQLNVSKVNMTILYIALLVHV
ncbi:hypothetical protein M5689_014946 [Euphorbia peplus]|nr:hypothetical protein M5689_014946 [Euphorbia peplus]